jgi:NAD(P)-dependent dehydrogenase (short-subunit alcohol dehydrogenase family)
MKKMHSVLITGCSSGIGLCVAQGLKTRGYRVFATARKLTDVEKLIEQGFESVQLDVDDSASIQTAVNWVLTQTGGTLDALFNNGAYGLPGAVEDLSRDALRAQFETNLFGWVELTNLIIPVMRKQGYGRLIFNSSVLGLVALPYRGAYVATKFALEGLIDTLRLELHQTTIQISLIEPGPISSRFRDNAHAMYKKYINPAVSFHRANYEAMESRLLKKGPAAPFTLPPDAVLKKVIHALESERPCQHYYITVPTHLFGLLRRLLSARLLDKLLLKISGGGSR